MSNFNKLFLVRDFLQFCENQDAEIVGVVACICYEDEHSSNFASTSSFELFSAVFGLLVESKIDLNDIFTFLDFAKRCIPEARSEFESRNN